MSDSVDSEFTSESYWLSMEIDKKKNQLNEGLYMSMYGITAIFKQSGEWYYQTERDEEAVKITTRSHFPVWTVPDESIKTHLSNLKRRQTFIQSKLEEFAQDINLNPKPPAETDSG